MDCIFCKVVAGEVPSERVYEDEHFLAIMDINPEAPGHVQIIPKQHFRFVWDLPDVGNTSPHIGDYFSVAHKVANAIRGTFGTDYCFSKVMGEEAPHAHVWLFPSPDEAVGDTQDIKGNAEKIRNQLENQ